MTKNNDYDIDINELSKNPTAIHELLNKLTSMHESLEESKAEAEKARLIFHEAIEVLDDGFVLYDEEDRLVTFNSAFRDRVGGPGQHLKLGDTFENITLKFAKSGIIPNIEGKEEEFVANLIEQRASEQGISKIFQTHAGEWIRQRDKKNDSGYLVGLRTDITELKTREEELANTTNLLTDTTESMLQGIVVFRENLLQYYNSRVLSLLNVTDSDIKIGQTYENFLSTLKSQGHYGDDGDKVIQKNIDMMDSGKHHHVERETHYGTHLKIDIVPKGDGDIILTYTDITELKKREFELELARTENETIFARQKKIAGEIAQGIIMFEDNKVVFYNDQALETLEISEEILFEEQTFEKFLALQVEKGNFPSKEEGNEFIEKHLNVASLGIPYQLERKAKSGRIIRVDGVPSKQENNLLLTFTDITNLKNREFELDEAKKAAEKASEILSTSASALVQGILFFHDDKLEYSNVKLLELIGAEEHQIQKGMSAVEILKVQMNLTLSELSLNGHSYDEGMSIDEHEQGIKDSFATKSPYIRERMMKNGKILRVDGAYTNKGGFVATYSDITESKQRELDLQATMKIAESAERAKSEFLANMSHEIRTPMNGVMGMAELLASTELDAKQKMFTDVIVKSGASLLTIINDILDFSKIDAGQMELDPAPFNLAEAIEDVATLVSLKVAEKDLELIVRIDPTLPKMMVGDVGRIRQIITNLLGNAVKFTEKGHVFVNIESSNDATVDNVANLKFSIEDTGIGIPKDKSLQIFQKFNQADTSATRKHEGTGLGLSISSSLVKLMGGKIGVDSDVGKGSTFWFTASLPVHKQDEDKHVVPGDMTGARILVIDDNQVNRSILAEQMSAWNFDGASTRTGEQGLEVMRNVIANGMSLDLVILDYQMPEMSGAEVLEIMRNDEALKDIPVVMLTSVDSSQANQRLLKLGAEANLTKPTRSSMLLETILQVIANKRADIKTRSINNLTAKSVPNMPTVTLPETKDANVVQDANQQLDILVAEDNEVNQIVFRQILEETGLNYRIVENGRLALAAYKAQKPRLILMDVSMPEMNGKEATIAIRKYEREKEMKRTPIVGVTAHALKGDMESCIDAGMDDYLSKPVSPNKLSLKIEQWLKVDLGTAITG